MKTFFVLSVRRWSSKTERRFHGWITDPRHTAGSRSSSGSGSGFRSIEVAAVEFFRATHRSVTGGQDGSLALKTGWTGIWLSSGCDDPTDGVQEETPPPAFTPAEVTSSHKHNMNHEKRNCRFLSDSCSSKKFKHLMI